MSVSVGKLNDIIEPVVIGMGYELLGLRYFPQGKYSLLRVYIDSETGINLDDCAGVSRQLSATLDVEDPLSGRYQLEVSSPGLDRPLFKPEHYQRFVGKEAEFKLTHLINGRKKVSGCIISTDDNQVQIEDDGKILNLAFKDIGIAHLIPELSL